MKRARLCIVFALLAGFSLHGQVAPSLVVQDIAGGTSFAPGSLAEVDASFYLGTSPTVTVAGQNAYVVSFNTDQIEIQIPVTAPIGANITVAAAGWEQSASFPITVSQYAPILMPQAVGASTVSAWHSDASPVSPAAPAMPNETINMYAVGLGPTTPVIPTGGTGNAQTTTVPSVTLASKQVTVWHATLGMASAGVYQVYFTVPANIPSGNQNVSMSIGAGTSNALTLAVGPNPAISAVLNNYSFILPGTPDYANYGIAPGSIFSIFGSGMATPGVQPVLQDSTNGLPLTLNGASIAITVAGITSYPALYFASATQIAAVLPSNTPPGTATITVTYNAMTSAPATFQVVPSALGFATMSENGIGEMIATDANYNLISPTNSAATSQIITLWGSGLGADIAVSDTTYVGPHQITNIPLTVYVGGSPLQVVWAGRSGYPGLDQINVQLPAQSSPEWDPVFIGGCAAQLIAASGSNNVPSNTVTLPVGSAGGACIPPS
jgi:uncharacterized protein (TIGR03437 family)